MTLKKIILALIVTTIISSCADNKLQISEGKKCVNQYLEAIKQKDFEKAISFFSNETNENRIDELKKLDDVFGDITNVQLIDSVETSGEEANIKLTYKITHTKLQSKENFIIIKDEGEYKIFSHQVRSGIE
jgi:hypothetical protein